MQKSNEKIIKSLTKAHDWQDKAKKIIDDSDKDEWVLGHYDNSKLLLETDDKTKSVLTSEMYVPINSEPSTNNNTIANKVIDTTSPDLESLSCQKQWYFSYHQGNTHTKWKKDAKRVWLVLQDSGSNDDILFVHPCPTSKYIPYKDHNAPQKMANDNWYLQGNEDWWCDILLPGFTQSKRIHIQPDINTLLAQLG